MPRGPVSSADQELLNAAAAAGYVVSAFQLERWRGLGLVPRNMRRGLGQGRGTVSVVPEDALLRLIAVARSARQGRTLIKGSVFLKLVSGEPVTDAALRAALMKRLKLLSRRFGLDKPGDAGWQMRFMQARAAARGGVPAGLDMVLNGRELTVDVGDDMRDAIPAWVQSLAGDVEGVSSVDLARLMAVGCTAAEVDHVVQEARSAELDGHDLASLLVPEMSVTGMIARVETTDAAVLRRAVTAVQTVQALHGLIFLQGMHQMFRRLGGPEFLNELPQRLTEFPEGIESLRMHPAYRSLSGIGFPGQLADVVVAMVSMTLVGQPQMLASVEDYCKRLVEIMGKSE